MNFFRVGHELYLVDLPGYGFARVPEAVRRSWDQLVTSYLVEREPLALGVFLVDARHDPMENDRMLFDWLSHHERALTWWRPPRRTSWAAPSQKSRVRRLRPRHRKPPWT